MKNKKLISGICDYIKPLESCDKPLSVNFEQIIRISTTNHDYFCGKEERASLLLFKKTGKLILTNKCSAFSARKGLGEFLKPTMGISKTFKKD